MPTRLFPAERVRKVFYLGQGSFPLSRKYVDSEIYKSPDDLSIVHSMLPPFESDSVISTQMVAMRLRGGEITEDDAPTDRPPISPPSSSTDRLFSIRGRFEHLTESKMRKAIYGPGA